MGGSHPEAHDVVVIGAGLAGLSCAVDLHAGGLDVVVLEASDGVGGRIRTDVVGDLLLDRGFQLLNPAYPALQGFVDLDALELAAFEAGVVVAGRSRQRVLSDPRRSPRGSLGALSQWTGSLAEKVRFGRYAARVALLPPAELKSRPDMPWGETLDLAGVSGRLRSRVLDPFLAGVLGEDHQESSRVFVDLLIRTFVRGSPSLPRGGMQALPAQLAARLPSDAVRIESAVRDVTRGAVLTDEGEIRAARVVVASDPRTAGALTGLPVPHMRGLTTYYHHIASSPATRKMIHVDGERRGPIVNTAVVSDIAPSYCLRGALVASTVLGAHRDSATQQAVQTQLASIHGVDTTEWALVAFYPIDAALPAMLPPLKLRQPVDLGGGLYVAGDHRDTASIQGAIVSGRRTARAVMRSVGAEPGDRPA